MAVPKSACIIVDYNSEQGMSVPRGAWPRLQQGVNFREPLTCARSGAARRERTAGAAPAAGRLWQQ
ncbi:hypothetical protein MNEG_3844 [Monoraphidium neglectum]|uniref:Uncharacterized protein n=1 Tax=Monoraphidium neglectum TaxID=145388 RepID=A0A0D2LBN4_9CHLO|nr:hypothetical protein MNEG_3844 [Monoraphidium neglectum]KIZ04119.1 hypothetical protein MNEG_3844 [Monoraphidium neglectum]|eukprot:XP_013903138.1 hypothetical protein MNEG_3844 [Monoraphidium neglectum]